MKPTTDQRPTAKVSLVRLNHRFIGTLYQGRAIRDLLIFLPLVLLSISLVRVGAVDAGPLPFQSSPPPAASPTQPPPPPPTDTPPPEQPAEPQPEQPAEPPTPVSPIATPTEEAPLQPEEELTSEAIQEEGEGEEPATKEFADQKNRDEESLDWALFVDTALAAMVYIWLCCGGLVLFVLPFVLAALYFVGRKRLLASSSEDNPP